MLAQVAHGSCVVSIFGDSKTLAGCSPVQSALADPARAGVGLCLPTSALLCMWFMFSEQKVKCSHYKLDGLHYYFECWLFYTPS